MKEIKNVPNILVVSTNVFIIMSDQVWGKFVFPKNNPNSTKHILRHLYFLCLQLVVQILSTTRVKIISLCYDYHVRA